MRCPHCSNTIEGPATSLPAVSGAHGALKLEIQGLPAMKCPKGHTAPVDGDFMFWLIQELKERVGKLPGGEEKGLLIKKALCACGKELPKSGAGKAFPADLEYEGKYRFRANLDAQVVTCPGCGKEQLRSTKEAQRDVAHAMADVTDAAGFPHGQ